MFERDHHNRIQTLLSALDTDFLAQNKCFFGGGTAIVLALNEYRESVDIDFLCASQEGYRELRNTIHDSSLGAIFSRPVELARDVRADRYGIRTFLRVDGVPVKFEIVSEGRIEIGGEMNPVTGVPTLTRADMYAEKLLANADRYRDKAVASRDIIDLAMMIGHWGEVPTAAWDKVRQAYGASADRAFQGAIEMISDRAYLGQCLAKMHMAPELVEKIPAVLRGEASFAPSSRLAGANTAAEITSVARGVRAVYGRVLTTPAARESADENRDAPSIDRPAS
ncbi:nucleotidyl transferase AbiEii/AbiGii toxin family protein [Massilia jejuensis]|uniref:Nucleotidyl transferase AbiEii/AbiGii toxin family protein n=1 Tax=Massilia jejuensis TaxID=648894 RepID=A0ABW0PM09_9BURK